MWENNVHFERAFEDFVVHLNLEQLSAQEIRNILDRFERAGISNQQYGARAFANSLADTWREITGSTDERELHVIQQFSLRILEIEMELINGVEETLEALRPTTTSSWSQKVILRSSSSRSAGHPSPAC